MDEILNKLQEIFRDVFDNEHLVITENMNANDIEGWDSLAHISLLSSIQDEFGICFELDEIIVMETIGDILQAIKNKI